MTKIETHAAKLINILNRAGFTALFAGGYVRDKIMKRKIHDIDIATNAKPDEIKKVLEKNKVKHIEIGEKFGVIAAVIPVTKKKNELFEIATFRQDFGSVDSRHPEKVKFLSDPKEDAIRRDFTMNGLFLEISNFQFPISNEFSMTNFQWGKVLDCVNGIQDIKNKTIRFIGNPQDRITEDALRMMRAVRFSCQLGFSIEEKSLEAIKKNKNLIKEISYERIRDELTKILESENRVRGMMLLDELGILNIILPELEAMKKTNQPKNMHFEGNVWNHTLLGLEKIRNLPDINKNKSLSQIAWATLLHDVGKPITIQTPEKDGTDRIRFSGHDSEGAKLAEKILRRFKISNDEIDVIIWTIKYHMLFSNFGKMRTATRIRYLADKRFPQLLNLFWIDANSSVRSAPSGKVLAPDLTGYNKALKAFTAEKGKPKLPKPFLRGDKVMKLMNISEGNKLVGDILREVFDAQLEKKVKNKKEAIKIAEKLLKKMQG